MPASNIEEVLANKPVTFNIKTSGGSWKCQIHSNRAAYERTKSISETAPIPGIARTDSGLSTTSTASTSSSKSSH
ncbi:hypothetical protein ONZ43_g5594 [Nemania bipapillata]|uniref:Uncharacterized protein n=1 Tax=Nemania bipapillata TaxID=110536 RepID=A0ACC2I8T0_9PEZI|nr:hypothetical protein ONZ43_g5594 [Nemania bipapillata]